MKQQPFLDYFSSHFAQYSINQWHSLSEEREATTLREFRKALDIYDKTTIPDFIWSFSSLKLLLQSSLQNSGLLFSILQAHKNITANQMSKGLQTLLLKASRQKLPYCLATMTECKQGALLKPLENLFGVSSSQILVKSSAEVNLFPRVFHIH